MTEGAGTKETKDDSLKAGSPGSLLVSWQDKFSEQIPVVCGAMPFHYLQLIYLTFAGTRTMAEHGRTK